MDREPFSIHPALESHIRKQSDEEFRILEESILAEGVRDPLVVWKEEGVLVDGHHRKKVCDRHNLPFQVVYRSFKDLEAAKAWMDLNQLGRRNLSKEDRDEMIRRLAGQGHKQKDIAMKVGLSKGHVSDIVNRQSSEIEHERPINSTSSTAEITAMQEKIRVLEASKGKTEVREIPVTPPELQKRLEELELSLKQATTRTRELDQKIQEAKTAGKDYDALLQKKIGLQRSLQELADRNDLAQEEKRWALVVVNAAREIRETLNRQKGVIEEAARKGIPAWANANAIRECAERCFEVGELLKKASDVVDIPTGEEGEYERFNLGEN